MKIQHWPIQERPRERLLKQGAAALSNAELLAILLRNGTRGKDSVSLARELLNQHQHLKNLFSLSFENFSQKPGLGLAKYAQLQAALEIGKRYLQEGVEHAASLHCGEDTQRYLMAELRNHPHEVFACLFLDNAHRLIRFEKLFHGTINTTTVHPREIIRRALYHNAASVIFAHNHPSGIAKPSPADIRLTQSLSETLKFIDVRVLDHFIIGAKEVCSFVELGLMNNFS